MRPDVAAFLHADSNTWTYLVSDPATRQAALIDPVLDYDPKSGRTSDRAASEVQAAIERDGLQLRWLLETHAHADHLTGAAILRRRFEARVAIGAPITQVQETFKGLLGLEHLATDGRQFDRLVKEGDVIEAGSLAIHVIETPGHTPACVTYRIGDALFTGDLLFLDDYGTGRCDFPGGSAERMYDSIQKLYAMPEATRVYPGHDYPPAHRTWKHETTIGASKDHNPQLSGRTSKESFVAMRTERDRGLASPRLLFPSIQINVDGGRMPPEKNGRRYLVTPINLFRPADELGERRR